MAVYHRAVKIIRRATGRRAVAAAYHSGERLDAERTGDVHDYRRKTGVKFRRIVTPDEAPT